MTTPRTLTAEPWLDVDGVHLEGVTWDGAAGRLRFVDIPRGRVFDVDEDGAGLRRLDLPAPVTAVHPTTDPATVLIADGDGMALVRSEAGATPVIERLAAPLADRPGLRMNDGRVGPGGRYFAGSMAYDQATGAGALYRLDPDRSLRTVLPDVSISNGIDWSPDGSLCYFVDTPLRRVDVFDHDTSTGELSGRRVLVDTSHLPGFPDGLTVDAEGSVWVAFWGGWQVCCFSPDGRLEATVALPVTRVTSCTFGGSDLDRLYVSTSTEDVSPAELAAQPGAGFVFLADPGRRGRAATPFPLPAPAI